MPLLVELAGRLRAHLADKLPTARAFTLQSRMADMLYADLERAGFESLPSLKLS